MYNIRNGAIPWQIPDFSYDGKSNFGSISHNLWDIRKTNKMPKICLESEVKVKEEKNGTCIIRLELLNYTRVIFFRILATWENTFTQKVK